MRRFLCCCFPCCPSYHDVTGSDGGFTSHNAEYDSYRSSSTPRESLETPRTSREMFRRSIAFLDKLVNVNDSGEEDVQQMTVPYELLDSGENVKLGKLDCTVTYDYTLHNLSVKAIKATNLKAMDISGTSDPYVKMCILPERDHKIQTKVIWKKLNPKWSESLIIEGFPIDKLTSRTLNLKVVDYDRLARDDPIGEVQVPLRYWYTDDPDRARIVFGISKFLSPCKNTKGYVGELNISLCYHKNTNTISVSVLRARGLKRTDISGTSDPYCSVCFFIGNRCTEKVKTDVVKNTTEPVWNKVFVFNAPPQTKLTDVHIDVFVKNKILGGHRHGGIRLGSEVVDDQLRQWTESVTNPDVPKTAWHVLKHKL